ncbi:hypothetical protein U0070_001712 [Myodes glareolus]|uniref:Uncharacterized protein n=1 Tax=Myodes glareolus TaxID=447135 RepID=A0AAW0JDW8_MYOGA
MGCWKASTDRGISGDGENKKPVPSLLTSEGFGFGSEVRKNKAGVAEEAMVVVDQAMENKVADLVEEQDMMVTVKEEILVEISMENTSFKVGFKGQT